MGRYLPTLVTRLSLSPPPTVFLALPVSVWQLASGPDPATHTYSLYTAPRVQPSALTPQCGCTAHPGPGARTQSPSSRCLCTRSPRGIGPSRRNHCLLPSNPYCSKGKGKRGKRCCAAEKKRDTQHEEAVGDLESLLASSPNNQRASLARPPFHRIVTRRSRHQLVILHAISLGTTSIRLLAEHRLFFSLEPSR